MDYNDHSAIKSVSVLQGDGFFLNRIISRESTVGQSSRIYYRGTAEGVPFEWEMQPGTPKNPPRKEIIPPPSPPPAMQSLGLPRPCVVDQPRASTYSSIWFWKKNKKSKKVQRGQMGSDKFESFEFGDSDGEFIASDSRCSSSSSSSLSSSNGPPLQQSRFGKDLIDVPSSCSRWNFTKILVGIGRRI